MPAKTDVSLDPVAALMPGEDAGPRKVPTVRKVLVFVAMFSVSGVVGALAARALGDAPAWQLVPLLASLVLSLWLQLIVHEAGHALAGMARGMRPVGIGLGPLRMERGVGGWRTRWGGGVRGIGGFAALVPAPDRARPARDEAIYLAGGPLANLAAAAVAAIPLASGATGLWAGALWMFAGVGTMLGVINLLPFHSQGWRSDGRGLLDLLRAAPDALQMRRMTQLASLSMAGVRARDWPAAMVPPLPGADAAPAIARMALMLRHAHALDTGADDDARACAHALRALHHDAPDGVRQISALTLASHAALVERDRALLAAWRPRCEGGLLDLGAHRAWLDAELAALAGDRPARDAALARARDALPRVHDAGSARVLGEWIDRCAAA